MNRSRARASIFAILLVIGLGISREAVTTAAPPDASAANAAPILFEDDFNGPAGGAPDPSRWEDYSACSYNPSAAFGAIACGDNEKLDGAGHLVVPATPRSGSGIRTGDRFSFRYGTMSAWIQLPPQPGYWPAFWSLDSRADGSTDLPVGEVDAMEGYTTWLNAYHATAHNYGADGSRYDASDARCAESSPVDLSAQFHKYSARIEPGKVTFFFDDVQCGSVYTKAAGRSWGFGPDVTRGNWLILDLAVGGASGQQRQATSDARMIVDRVEVRALPSASTATQAPQAALSTPTPAARPAASASVSGPAPVSDPAPTPSLAVDPHAVAAVENAAIYRLVNACGGMVLDVPAPGTAAGVRLRTGVWSGRDSQRWRVVSLGSGYYKLINIGSGQALNVAYSSQSSGAAVIQYPDVSGPNAQWRITPVGGGAQQLTARHSGKALDVRGAATTAGAAVDQAQPAPGCAQQWSLVPS